MRYINFIFAALFFLVAYLQFNDPDPLVWISLYGFLGIVALGVGFGARPKSLLCVAVGALMILMLQAFPGVVENLNNPDGFDIEKMSDDRPYVEETREFGGLLISWVWAISALAIRKRIVPNGAAPSERQLATRI